MLKFTKESNQLTLYFEGHIDSTNAPVVENDIFNEIKVDSTMTVVVDASNLSYISSAGLRVILKLRKTCPTLSIIEVSNEVYDIFEMTGFSEMINITKAYRTLSIDGCEKLGEGSNGIVYRYDPEIIVKVYKKADALDEIKRERELARIALILGIPTAIPFDVVKVGDKYGSVFELLNAKSYSKLIVQNPEDKDKYIRLFVDLLKKIHETKVSTDLLTDIKSVTIDRIKFLKGHIDDKDYDKLLSMTENIEERHTMIHGDYHTSNVEMQNGESLLIDMDTLSYGHPIFEFAPMYLAFVGFGDVDQSNIEKFLHVPYDITSYIWKETLRLYFNDLPSEEVDLIEKKAMLLGYARLLRRTIKRCDMADPMTVSLLNNCKDKIHSLLECVNELNF